MGSDGNLTCHSKLSGSIHDRLCRRNPQVAFLKYFGLWEGGGSLFSPRWRLTPPFSLHLTILYTVHRVGEGRRPWATTISPSGPHTSFLLFRQPWATTFFASRTTAHLTLQKSSRASRKKAQLKPFFQFYIRLIYRVFNS